MSVVALNKVLISNERGFILRFSIPHSMKIKLSNESNALFSRFAKEVSAKKRRRYERTWKDFVISLRKTNLNLSAESIHKLADELILNLQDAMQKNQQVMQMLSNIMKNMHDTTKSIIQNMR